VVGIDIAGYEESPPGQTPSPSDPYVEIFRQATAAGLKVTAHAGEKGPPAHIRTAVFEWGAKRIGHGIKSIQDPELMAQLIDQHIVLEICPTSNLALGMVPSLEAHPVDQLRQAGIAITINTDDPSLFGTTLSEELLKVATTFGWSQEIVLQVVRTAWQARFK
jgi:adenosine deaminase